MRPHVRIVLLDLLEHGPSATSDIVRRTGLSAATVSHDLLRLRGGNLARSRRGYGTAPIVEATEHAAVLRPALRAFANIA